VTPRFKPPLAVRRNAADGLDLVRDGFGGRGLTEGALDRAWSLYRGHAIDLARARMMHRCRGRCGLDPLRRGRWWCWECRIDRHRIPDHRSTSPRSIGYR
jgi:hypothetical protein